MSTLSVAELQAQVETDLSNTTLQLIIDAVERGILEYVGSGSSIVHEYDGNIQYQDTVRLPVQGSSITSIEEWTDAGSDPTKTTLAADDYELSDDGYWVRRLSDGTNSRTTWGWHLVVTFAPADDTERRKQAAVELARLQIIHTGYDAERSGDWSATTSDQRQERTRILSGLDTTLVT